MAVSKIHAYARIVMLGHDAMVCEHRKSLMLLGM